MEIENPLEIVKLTVSAATPVVLFALGVLINNSIKKSERSTSLRSEIYKLIGGDLNDIYSYIAFVGVWKELSPACIIKRKRAVDKAMHTYKPFFSEELFSTYNAFMREAFSTYGAAGTNARIRSKIENGNGSRRLHNEHGWKPEWEYCFTEEENSAAQLESYNKFLMQLARDLKL